ncbi:MAG TPA: DUF4169 family protein [Stellaceae bacterium]|jgi:hypothetical protein|nr:DUF4169 family protein [Stellaceae bacterium]
MGEIVNLNKFRKAKSKAEAQRLAASNRTKFGRTKAEKSAKDIETHREERDLDGKRLD